MSIQYDEYLKKHITGVKRSYEWIKRHLPDILLVDEINRERMDYIIEFHDASKYSVEEYIPYDIHFYGDTKTEQSEHQYQKAWLRHLHNNPHHWQHWILINDNPEEGKICLQMPYEYVIEMICDWWSFSWNSGKLTEIFNWYNEHKNNIDVHEETRRQINYILDKIKSKLKELDVE